MFLGEASLPDGLRIYAIGDIHGRADCLVELLDAIADDKKASPPALSKIVFLGDYTDRGPQSREVIGLLAARANASDFICLRGNHDQWFLEFLTHPDEAEGFLHWGGIQTLQSYGVETGSDFPSSVELSRELSRRVPPDHRRFLSGLKHWHEEGDFFFCHAGVRPGISLHHQDPHDLMWIRGEFHAHRGSFGKVIVHGHTPHDEVDFRPNRINIDTRAFDTGVLTALVIEGSQTRLIQTAIF